MMISEDRKRKLSKANRGESRTDVETPKKKHKTEAYGKENAEDGVQWIGKKLLSGVLTWIIDVTTKNYFVDSAMSAFNLGSHQNGKSKSRLRYKYQIEVNNEEMEEPSSSFTRRDLKRAPLCESYKKSQMYLSFSNQLPNQRKSGNFSVRNECPISLKQSTTSILENRKVIENPFDSSLRFHKARSSEINGASASEKMENSKNGFEVPLVPAGKTSSLCDTNTERTVPATGANGLKPFPPFQVGQFQYKKKGRTNDEVLALHEKDQYQLLLEHFTKFSVGSTFQKRDLALKNKEVQTNLCGNLPSESSLEQQAFKKIFDPEATKFFAKYFKGHTYGISPTIAPDRRSLGVLRVGVKSSVKDKGENEDDLIISEVKVPQPRTCQQQSSPFFSAEWLNELKKSFNEETENKVKVIRQQEEKIKQFRESRAARLAADDKALEQHRVSGSTFSEAEVEDTSVEFPELTEKMEEIIDEALNPQPPEEVLCVGFNISVSRKDLETLSGLNWLNDEIIYFYMNLLMERSKNENYPSVYAFNTFFYPKLMNHGHSALKRWTRKEDIFSYDLLLVPVHMGMHWCLAVIDFRHKKIRYYDSMGGQNTDCLHALRDYLKDERMDKKKQNYDMTGWVYENVKNIPHQMNGSDCGMFALKYAEYITRDAKITFTQDHMQYFRRRMVYEILMKQLL